MEQKTELSVIHELEWETERRHTVWLPGFSHLPKGYGPGYSPMERRCSPLILYFVPGCGDNLISWQCETKSQ